MSTWANLIDEAFIALNVIRPGESVTAAVQANAFLLAQQRWAVSCLQHEFTNAWYRQTFTLAAGTSAYTVGTAGTLVSTVNPIRIKSWKSVSGSFESGGDVISFDKFDALTQNPTAKSSVLAEAVAADAAYPSQNLRVFPVPATAPGSLILEYYGLMTQPAAVSDAVAFAAGYENFIVNDLALELAPTYARTTNQNLQAIAANRQNALAIITAKGAGILGLVQAPPQQAA